MFTYLVWWISFIVFYFFTFPGLLQICPHSQNGCELRFRKSANFHRCKVTFFFINLLFIVPREPLIHCFIAASLVGGKWPLFTFPILALKKKKNEVPRLAWLPSPLSFSLAQIKAFSWSYYSQYVHNKASWYIYKK